MLAVLQILLYVLTNWCVVNYEKKKIKYLFIKWFKLWLNEAYQAVDIEALAAILALEFAAKVGLDKIVVEGNSKIITDALDSKETSLAVYGLLVEDACVFESNFSELSYSHVKREGNKVAICLAKLEADDAAKNHQWATQSLHARELAKYPPNVKLGLFSQL